MASQIQFCRTVGVHHLQTRQSGATLSTRLLEPAIQKYIMKEIKEEKKVEGVRRKNETPPEIKYFLGQGTSADTPEQAATLLLKREYPDIFHDLSGFGTIAIPEGFIPSISKIIDQDVIDKLDEETRKRYQDMIKKFPGDFAERIAYHAIKDYYKRKGSDTVLVQGLEIINLSNPSQHRESDFIIVNVEKRYILNIEVKNFLGPWIWNHGKPSNRKENKKQKVR